MSAAAAARWREAASVFGFLRYPRMLMRGNKLPHAVLGDVGGCEKRVQKVIQGLVFIRTGEGVKIGNKDGSTRRGAEPKTSAFHFHLWGDDFALFS